MEAWEQLSQRAVSQPVARFTSDHLGSPRYITNGNYGDPDEGHIIGEQAFGPYGKAMEGIFATPGGSLTLPWGHRPVTGYTGHLNEDPTNLIYMKGRYYSPRWHRFINSDRGADPYSLNQTVYVGGSPFEATDPMGLEMKAQAQHTWYLVDMYDVEVWAAKLEGGGGVREYYAYLAEKDTWDLIRKMSEESARNAADDSDSQLGPSEEELGEIAEIMAKMMGEMDAKQLKELKNDALKHFKELYNKWAKEQRKTDSDPETADEFRHFSRYGPYSDILHYWFDERYPQCIEYAEALAKYLKMNSYLVSYGIAEVRAEPTRLIWMPFNWASGGHYHVVLYMNNYDGSVTKIGTIDPWWNPNKQWMR